MYKYFITLGCVLFIVACGNNAGKDGVFSPDIVFAGDTITLKENSPIIAQITVQKAQLQDFSAEFRTVGTVRPEAGKLAEITPPFPGRIVKSFVRLGQKVSEGATIFEFGSSEFYEAVKTYFTALSANEVAKRNYNRQKELAANGVASQKDLEEAQSEAMIVFQELEQAKATLRIFNINTDSGHDVAGTGHNVAGSTNDIAGSGHDVAVAGHDLPLQMGQPLRMASPIAGEVVKCNITIGSYVKEDSEPLAVVADLSNVWVVALVKEKYFGAIKLGDRVEVYTDAHPNKIIWGSIYHIGEMLDEETRSLEVIVTCNNADRELKLGMFCETHFLSAPTKAIILPSTAVMQEQDDDCVYVEIAKGQYVRRKVKTESVHRSEVHIISGVTEGENVVVEGGFYLQ